MGFQFYNSNSCKFKLFHSIINVTYSMHHILVDLMVTDCIVRCKIWPQFCCALFCCHYIEEYVWRIHKNSNKYSSRKYYHYTVPKPQWNATSMNNGVHISFDMLNRSQELWLDNEILRDKIEASLAKQPLRVWVNKSLEELIIGPQQNNTQQYNVHIICGILWMMINRCNLL